MTVNTVYLITGANRGLGLGYVKTYLSRADTTVIAAVRDPSAATSKSLGSLPSGEGSKLHIVKLDAAVPGDAAQAIAQITELGITKVDVAIANAGITGNRARVDTVELNEIDHLLQVNTYSIILLFQALIKHGLLQAGSKFILTGSAIGSIGGIDQRPFADTAYGLSKAAVHWLSRKIHQEHPDLVVFNLDPGFAQTDMGNAGAQAYGMEKAWTPVDDAVSGLVNAIDAATRETHGGKYVTWDGSDFPW